MMRSLTVTVEIATTPDDVMAYASDPRHLPDWAPGLAVSVKPEADAWRVQMLDGTSALLWFTPPNADGILDHTVRLPNGVEVLNQMRVAASHMGSEVSFVLNQLEGMSDEQFEQDADQIRADLDRLRIILED
jgi:hypothetical protein